MAPIRRHDHPTSKRSPVVLALVAGIIFGLIVALLNVSRSPTNITNAATSAAASLENEADALHQKVFDLTSQLQEAKSERDAARRQLADQVQLQKDLEARLDTQQDTAITTTKSISTSEEYPDRHTPWLPSAERDKSHPGLAKFLRKIAINKEVLVAVSNRNYAWPGGLLELWMKSVQLSGVKNAMVVALDDDTKTNVEAFGFPAYRLDMEIPDSQKDNGGNHAVSALKFRILKPFLELGYGVLLADVDIVTLQDPFKYLVRDSDVESLSDGWDAATAYGYNDVADDKSMGWARYAHSMRIFVFNSGLFYLRPTQAAIDLLDKVIHRVETENGWDQALFNECIFFPNSPVNKDPSVTRRTMDFEKFMNSKYLFKYLRHDAQKFSNSLPVMVHVNYHPDKFERMQAVWARYVDGDLKALDKFPNGSE